MKTNTARNIIATGAHIGSPKFNWQPISERFAIGYRNGLLIYNIAFSNFYIRKALNFVERCVFDFGRMYIYGLIKQYDSKNINIFRRIDQVVCIKPWHGGFITNFRTFRKYFKNNKSFAAVVSLVHDHKNYSISHESSLIKLPIVSPVDSSANPENFTYPIPANTVNSEIREYIALNFGIAVFRGLIRRTLKRLVKKKKKIYKKIKKKEEKRKKVKELKKNASRFKRFVRVVGGKSKLYKNKDRSLYWYDPKHWTIRIRRSLKRISSIKKLLRTKISEILLRNKKKSRLEQKLIRINRRITKKKIRLIKYVRLIERSKKIYDKGLTQTKYTFIKRILKYKKIIKVWDDKVIPLLKKYPFVKRKRVKIMYDVAFYAIGARHRKPKLKVPRKYIERYRNRKLNKIRRWSPKKAKFIDFKKKILKSIKRKKKKPATRRKKKTLKLVKIKKNRVKATKKKKIYKKIKKKKKSTLKSIKRKKKTLKRLVKKKKKIKVKKTKKKPVIRNKRILKLVRLIVKKKSRKSGKGFLFRKEKDKFVPKHIIRKLKKRRFFFRWRGKWRNPKLTKRKKIIRKIKFGIKRVPKSFSKTYKKKKKRKFGIKSPKSPVRKVARKIKILRQKKWFEQLKKYKKLIDIRAYKRFNRERLRIAKLIAKKKAKIEKEEKFAKLAREKGYAFLLNSKKPIRKEERKFVELLGRSDRIKMDPKVVVQQIKKLLVQRIDNITKERHHEERIRQERINSWRGNKPYYKKYENKNLKSKLPEEDKKKLTRKEKRKLWFANNKHRIKSNKLLWEEVESNHHSKLFRLELYH